jgi:hypothetical protein
MHRLVQFSEGDSQSHKEPSGSKWKWKSKIAKISNFKKTAIEPRPRARRADSTLTFIR